MADVSRRGLITGGVGVAALGAGFGAGWVGHSVADPADPGLVEPDAAVTGEQTVAFYGDRQSGIDTPDQAHVAYLAFTLREFVDRERMQRLMRILSDDASRLTQGQPTIALTDPDMVRPPARLTVTFGFGQRVFEMVGADVPPGVGDSFPAFSIDRLQPEYCGGDLLIKIASDDLITLSHVARVMTKNAKFFATVAWRQEGFRRARHAEEATATMRNLFGQKDGTANAALGSDALEAQVWGTGDGFAPWTPNGTTFVLRRIAMNLETWDEVDPSGRENTIGRTISSGAPLTGTDEFDEPDFEARNDLGFTVIDTAAHIRRARHSDARVRFHRSGYNYDVGVDAEGVADVGLLFGTWQSSITEQYVPVQQSLADLDLLNTWTTPIGSATFAIPPGAQAGGYVGEELLG